MPGSGVRSSNITDLKNETGATQFHSSARILKKTSMDYVQPFMTEDLSTIIADRREIEEMVSRLKV
jgi:copper homeostasis protein